MFARFFARRRLRKANAVWKAAYYAYREAEARQQCQLMHITAAVLRNAQSERIEAEVSLSKLEGFGGLRGAA